MYRSLFLLYNVIFWICLGSILSPCVASSVSLKKKDPPPNDPKEPPKDPNRELEDHCSKDLQLYCPETRVLWSLYCLYENKSKLSQECQDYLGSTTLGACNNEALTLCGDYESVEDITKCLEEHSNELSTDCLKNLKNNNEYSNRIKEMRESLLGVTRFVTVLSAIFLTIPLLFSLWCCYKLYHLLEIQAKVLEDGKEFWKAESEVLKIVRACDFQEGNSREPSNHEEEEQSWKLSFHSLNYWAIERKHWTEPFSFHRKKILNNVSGQLKSSTITAIMGPSGSGKTTLLKLIGGHMYQGEFSGTRAINNIVYPRKKYDEVNILLFSA
jgi:hypothetical protein